MKSTTDNNKTAKRTWQALAVLCAAQFMVIMDTSIIGVALPAIQNSLHYAAGSLHWIFNAYVIAFGGLLLLGGKLSDIFGPKRIFLAGFWVLTLASLLAGLAWSDVSLNTARAIQGIGAALIAPSALSLLMILFGGTKDLGKAMGFWGASAAAGGSAGVFLGGLLTDFLGWEWTFFINIPIGLIVILTGKNLLPKGQRQNGKIDYLGALLITAAISVLVFALVQTNEAGSMLFGNLQWYGLFVLLFIAFLIRQRMAKEVLIPFSVFKAPNLSQGNLVMALLAASWIPLWFFFNLFLQEILHFTAFESGLALLPMTLVIMLLMVGFSEKIIQAWGMKKPLVLGMILLVGSLFWFAALPANASYFGQVIWPSLLAAAGMSLAYVPATITSISGAKPEEAGVASGLVNSTYQIGSAIGLALAVAISGKIMAEMPEGTDKLLTAHAGFSSAFVMAAWLAAAGALIAILTIRFGKK